MNTAMFTMTATTTVMTTMTKTMPLMMIAMIEPDNLPQENVQTHEMTYKAVVILDHRSVNEAFNFSQIRVGKSEM